MAEATNRPNRAQKKRKPIGRKNKLVAPKKKGYVRRFINDIPGRLQEFLDAGYTVVNDGSKTGDDNVGRASKLGGNSMTPVGGGLDGILVEIQEDWYREDQANKQKEIDKKEESLLLDENGNPLDKDKVFGELKINRNNKAPSVQIE